MNITYKKNLILEKEAVIDLFSSVRWKSREYPEDLAAGLKNSSCVYTAWQDSQLVGLINGLSDGYMVVYFHYVLVRPEYQKLGIGKRLLELMLEEYKHVHTKVLIAYNRKVKFYRKFGFEKAGFAKPMFLTDMPEEID